MSVLRALESTRVAVRQREVEIRVSSPEDCQTVKYGEVTCESVPDGRVMHVSSYGYLWRKRAHNGESEGVSHSIYAQEEALQKRVSRLTVLPLLTRNPHTPIKMSGMSPAIASHPNLMLPALWPNSVK